MLHQNASNMYDFFMVMTTPKCGQNNIKSTPIPPPLQYTISVCSHLNWAVWQFAIDVTTHTRQEARCRDKCVIMSEGGDQEGGTNALMGDAEACNALSHEDLLSRVRSVFTVYDAIFNGAVLVLSRVMCTR